jgi:hypothetical protein
LNFNRKFRFNTLISYTFCLTYFRRSVASEHNSTLRRLKKEEGEAGKCTGRVGVTDSDGRPERGLPREEKISFCQKFPRLRPPFFLIRKV